MATRTRVRPKLAIDLGEQVSKDLLIEPLKAHQGLTAHAGLQASAGLIARQGLVRQELNRAGKLKPLAVLNAAAGAIRAHQPPLELVQSLRARIASVLPSDGDHCYALTHGEFTEGRIGETFKNYNECQFWLGSQHQIDYAVDEWMNSEYEWVSEMFYDRDEPIPHWAHEGFFMAPEIDTLLEAWDAVATQQGNHGFLVPVLNTAGVPVSNELVSAEEIMGWYGIDRTAIVPSVIIADRLIGADLISIENDEEVTLDDGNYVITEVELDGDIAVFHIEPK